MAAIDPALLSLLHAIRRQPILAALAQAVAAALSVVSLITVAEFG